MPSASDHWFGKPGSCWLKKLGLHLQPTGSFKLNSGLSDRNADRRTQVSKSEGSVDAPEITIEFCRMTWYIPVTETADNGFHSGKHGIVKEKDMLTVILKEVSGRYWRHFSSDGRAALS
jgi:hypothetical protein